jgi:lysophospholipase L1-like esterase
MDDVLQGGFSIRTLFLKRQRIWFTIYIIVMEVMNLRKTIVLVLLLVTAGCGGKESQVIVTFGDSNTQGANWGPRHYATSEKWVNLLSNSLRGEYRVVNAGIGGETTEDARYRFERDVLERKPEYLFIMFGTNDAAILSQNVPRVSKDRFKENLTYFVLTSKKHRIKPVLMTCLPLVEGKNQSLFYYSRYHPKAFEQVGGARAWHNSYNAIVRETAKETNVPLIDNWQTFVQKAGGASDKKLIESGLIDPSGNHMTPKGSRVVYQEITDHEIIQTH